MRDRFPSSSAASRPRHRAALHRVRRRAAARPGSGRPPARARPREPGYTERTLLMAEPGFKWGELAQAGASQSLFAQQQVARAAHPDRQARRGRRRGDRALLRALPPDTVTLVHLPALDWRTQKARWFEALERAGVLVEARTVTRKALPQWLAGRLARRARAPTPRRWSSSPTGSRAICWRAWQEVQKLALLLPAGKLTDEHGAQGRARRRALRRLRPRRRRCSRAIARTTCA